MDGTSKKKEKKSELGTSLSRGQQSSNWDRWLKPRHAPCLTAIESQHLLTQLTQHATHEIEKKNWLYAKGHSTQLGMFWRVHHTKSEPKIFAVDASLPAVLGV
jgi:hypothetical protein